jgi:hypothetical protein
LDKVRAENGEEHEAQAVERTAGERTTAWRKEVCMISDHIIPQTVVSQGRGPWEFVLPLRVLF